MLNKKNDICEWKEKRKKSRRKSYMYVVINLQKKYNVIKKHYCIN